METEEDAGKGLQQQKMENGSEYGSVAMSERVQMKKEVGLIGGISLIVGTIVGSGIFISPKGVLDMTGSVGLSLVVWTGSGLLALLGATCYAELGTLVRKSGGEYAYIMEALGSVPAFLFAWTSVLIIRPSSIAIICLTFAQYTVELMSICGTADIPIKLVAAVAIVTLMLINCYSVKITNQIQIIFTFTKLAALGIIIVGGIIQLAKGKTEQFKNSFEGSESSPSIIALAFYQALWAYDGWNNLNYVTEEIHKPEKNIPRANIAGIILVTVVYLLTNISYLTAMTAAELLDSSAVAVTWGDRILKGASIILPIAVLFSTFGAANGSVFTGGRVVYVAGREGHLPEMLSFVHVKRLTPVPSIIFTCAIASAMIGISNIESLVDFFSFTAWLFYGTAVSSLLVMRYTKRDVKRVIKVPIVFPILFVLCAIYLVIAPIVEDPKIEFLYAIMFVFGGLIFYVPLVHFKLVSIGIIIFLGGGMCLPGSVCTDSAGRCGRHINEADKITMYFQLFFETVPSPYMPDE